VVVGVWPDGSGFLARLEAPRRAGVPAMWARWRHGLELWPFPEDPGLPALRGLIESDHQLLGHRLGRRATLASPDGTQALHLRPPRSAPLIFQRWREIHAMLARAGIPTTTLHSVEGKPEALRSEWLAVAPPAGDSRPDALRALGSVLARAHAAPIPEGLPARGPGAALDATVRALAIAAHAGTLFTQWLERRLERWRLLGPSWRHARALIHGHFRACHVSWQPTPMVLDWDRAGAGDPEQDLGTMAADLYWRRGVDASPDFAAVLEGYRAEQGVVHSRRFEYYARLALVRLLASKALSQVDQVQVRARQRHWVQWPEVVAGF
jgi:aminoglycoside phosphotransferase (APT) family kinase protein